MNSTETLPNAEFPNDAIATHRLTKHYNGRRVVDSLNLRVPKGTWGSVPYYTNSNIRGHAYIIDGHQLLDID